MKTYQIKNEIKEIKSKLKELESILQKEETNKTGWENEDEFYYYISMDGAVERSFANNRDFDNYMYSIGNCFSDEQLAEKMAKRVSLMLRMQRFSDENGGQNIDWTDEEQPKYYISYCVGDEFIVESTKCFFENHVYFYTYQATEEAIRLFGDELAELCR